MFNEIANEAYVTCQQQVQSIATTTCHINQFRELSSYSRSAALGFGVGRRQTGVSMVAVCNSRSLAKMAGVTPGFNIKIEWS
jgi:hypothetical protein